MGGQDLGPVREAGADIPPSILIEHDGADFGIPEDFEPLTLGIVRDAREVEGLKVVRFPLDLLNEPWPPSKLDETSRFDCRPNPAASFFSLSWQGAFWALPVGSDQTFILLGREDNHDGAAVLIDCYGRSPSIVDKATKSVLGLAH